MTRRPSTRCAFLLLAAVTALAAADAHGGLLDDLKNKAKDTAKRKAVEAVKDRLTKSADKLPGPPEEPADNVTGEYLGSFVPTGGGKAVPAVAKVFSTKASGGKLSFQGLVAAVEPGGLIQQTVVGKGAKTVQRFQVRGTGDADSAALSSKDFRGTVSEKKLTLTGDAGRFAMEFTVRKSPTLLAEPPAGATELFPYEPGKATSLDAWKNQRWKLLSDGSAMVHRGTNDSKSQWSDFKLHAEFRVPTQSHGNSGFYLLGRYEIQVLQSFGKPLYKGGCAAIYQTFPPVVDAYLPPGCWQTYDITFRAPKMDGEKVTQLPRITVVLNGVTVHDDVEIPHATGNARKRGHAASGPIRLQDHGAPVRYRNMWIHELK